MSSVTKLHLGECPLGLYEKALSFSWDWGRKLETVKELGFDFMEFSVDGEHISRLDMTDDEIRGLRDMSARLGVSMPTLALTANRAYPLGSRDVAVRDMGKSLVKKAIVFAGKLGVRVIQIAAYDVYGEAGDEETDRFFLESLRECERSAALAGVMLALETMDTPYAGSVQRCKRIVDIVGSPWVQIYADTGNIAGGGLDFAKDIQSGASHIVAVHLKDAKPGISRDIDFGTGIVDFDTDMKALREINFRGFLIAEMWWKDDPGYIDKVKAANKFLREKICAASV
ncbi:MAG: L-ribulose-5-phosphate 3-epimerase [Clostridiales bacterium]|nr:L-ribulose-5-phosphate 3-epimerase [Clostridiales bacterium]